MSRIFSFRDLLRIPAFADKNEIDLLGIEMDAEVNSYLQHLGFNINAAILYVPSKHRDIAGKVAVGYRASGEITQDRAYLNGPMCEPIERLIAASKTDMSLTKELSRMMGSGIKWDDAEGVEHTDFPEELIEPDYEDVAAEILSLEKLRDHIRGKSHNDSGALKTPAEYQGTVHG